MVSLSEHSVPTQLCKCMCNCHFCFEWSERRNMNDSMSVGSQQWKGWHAGRLLRYWTHHSGFSYELTHDLNHVQVCIWKWNINLVFNSTEYIYLVWFYSDISDSWVLHKYYLLHITGRWLFTLSNMTSSVTFASTEMHCHVLTHLLCVKQCTFLFFLCFVF